MQRRGSKILIIGDSIRSGVNRQGLSINVKCQPYPGANIYTIYEKVQMFDLTKFLLRLHARIQKFSSGVGV